MNIDIKRVKIFVTIPLDSVEKVREAVCNAGAGIIGEYTFCTSSTKSTGTFIPSENANPHIGERNKLEFVEEEKLEFVCEVEKVKNVIERKIAGKEIVSPKEGKETKVIDLMEALKKSLTQVQRPKTNRTTKTKQSVKKAQ